MRTILFLLIVGITTASAADEPPRKLSPEARKKLAAKCDELNGAGYKHIAAQEPAEAQKHFTESLRLARELYPKADFPDGHIQLVLALNGLATALQHQDKLADAEPLFREAFTVIKRLTKGDNVDVASISNNLAGVLQELGKYAEAEPLCRDSLAMYRRLFKGDHEYILLGLDNLSLVLRDHGRLADAEPYFREALEMRRRMVKGDHPTIATNLTNFAFVLRHRGKFAEAELAYRDAFEMNRRLYKGDHEVVADSMQVLANLLQEQGNYGEAEPLYRETLAMVKRLHKGDHPLIARAMNNLAVSLGDRVRYAEAEQLHHEALAMYRKLIKGDHAEMATTINNLGFIAHQQKKFADAEPLFREAFEMRKRLFKGDHPSIAESMNNLAFVLWDQGKVAGAEELFRDVLAMNRRFYKVAHPDVARSFNNLGYFLAMEQKPAEAEPMFRDALTMYTHLFKTDHPMIGTAMNNLANVLAAQGKWDESVRLYRRTLQMYESMAERFATLKAEGEALTLLTSYPHTITHYLRLARTMGTAPAEVYADVWTSKGLITRVVERRHLQARAAATNAETAALLAELSEKRRQRAELILAPVPEGPQAVAKRNNALTQFTERIDELGQLLSTRLPAVARSKQLAQAGSVDLQKVLPPDAVFVDFLTYKSTRKVTNPGKEDGKPISSFLAFVVTRDAVKWVDLGPASAIDKAVNTWRESITTPPFVIPDDVPAKVRELVWSKVRKEFPANTKVVYISPDLTLTRVPWSALPGDEPGKIVLEEFAVAVVPHALFLLDQLRPRDPAPKPLGGLLAVGGVLYDANPSAPNLWAAARAVGQTRGNIPVKPGAKLEWANLKFTKPEAEMAARIALRKKIPAEMLSSSEASTERVLAELPKAKYAHFATHGFFADSSFQSVLQVDPKLFEKTQEGQRIGAGALSPMTMSGLVFSGANKPETRGRGLVTGDHLIDRDLSGLELTVLSACETGLGDVAGGEGVFGLQRAFHLAGCRNVVASLWKVDDAATAALMNEFYTQLWVHDQPPVIALQKAQLAIYRADPKDFPKIASRGIEEGTIDLSNVPVKKYPANAAMKGNHPALWAAFTLSGAGR